MLKTRTIATLAAAAALATGCGDSPDQPARAAVSKPAPPPAQQDRLIYAFEGDLYAVGGDGRRRVRLTDTLDFQESDGRWSPDGRRVAYVRSDGGIHLMNADGSGDRTIYEGQGAMEGLAWSPDGRMIAFSLETPQGFELNALDVGTGKARTLRKMTDAWIGAPDWSPDGERIAVAVDNAQGGEMDVHVMRADGRRLRRVTQLPGDETSPRWSPDGRRLVFGRGGEGVYSVSPSGSDRRLLLKAPTDANALDVAFSPDGSLIAMTGKYEGGKGTAVFVAPAGGGAPTPISAPLPFATAIDW